MVKKVNSKKYENRKFIDFLKVAESFNKAAILAKGHEYYNAAGVLIFHSAIAYADSITIKLASQKISGESHYDIIALLKNVVPPQLFSAPALDHFKKLIDHKNIVSYSGDIYNKADIDILNKHFTRFMDWANTVLHN